MTARTTRSISRRVSGVTTPVDEIRSSTSSRSLLRTSSEGRAGSRLYTSGRVPLRYPRMSRKPFVATSVTRPSRPVNNAFVATVVPCETRPTSVASIPVEMSSERESANAFEGSAGVEGTFATLIVPLDPRATASVNVPPTSIATTQDSRNGPPRFWLAARKPQADHDVGRLRAQ